MKKRYNAIEDLWSICPKLQEVMTGTGIQGLSGNLHKSQGTSTVNNLLTIANLTVDLNAKNTLETGMAYGASTLAFLAAKSGSAMENGNHTAIDPFQRTHYDDCGVIAVKDANLNQKFECRTNFSGIELPRMFEADHKLDLIYIDGSHLFEDAFIDAYYSIRLLREGGIVLFDDCADRHVAKVVAFLRTNLKNSLKEVNLSQWRGDHGENWRYQVGRRLNWVQLTGFQKVADVQRKYGIKLREF